MGFALKRILIEKYFLWSQEEGEVVVYKGLALSRVGRGLC